MDMKGKTVFITGSTDGVGRYVATQLAKAGAKLLIHGRDAARAKALSDEIVRAGGSAPVFYQADLASLAETRSLAERVIADNKRLDVFISNAGIGSQNEGPQRQESRDGHELRFAANYLSGFLLAHLSLPLLKASAPSRIVNVASQLARDLDLEDVEFRRRSYSGVSAYAQSKQADRMLTWALARRLEGTAVTANAMHPGGVNTPLFSKGGGLLAMAASAFSKMAGKTPEEGADTVVWLATSPDVEGQSGTFWIDRHAVPCRFHDPAAEERLWTLCASMTRAA